MTVRAGRPGHLLAVVALTLACFLSGLMPLGTARATEADVAALSDEQRTLLGQLEEALGKITTLKARFVQVSSTGNYAEGTVYINRPWKMRIEYDPPTPVLVVADGNFLIYHDSQLDQYSHVPLGLTPAGLLLKPGLSFADEDVKLEGISHQAGTIEVRARQADDPDAGMLTLVFTDSPLELRQWKVLDPQGVQTTVSLFDARLGLDLDSDLFYLAVPAGNRNDTN